MAEKAKLLKSKEKQQCQIIISATRSILSIGARIAVENLSNPDFIKAMIELGVNALVVLVLGITLKLLGKLVKES